MNIYVLCGNAAYNKGDRGNLDTQIKLLRRAFPQAQIMFDSFRSQVDATWYDATVIKRGWPLSWEQIKALAAADVVVWGGGALIADNACRLLVPMWFFTIGFVKFVLRKRVMAWAHGVVLETRLGNILAKIIYNWVDLIAVRDENSLQAIRRLGPITPPVFKTADPAILVTPKNHARGREVLADIGISLSDGMPLMAISPTYWPFYHRSSDVVPFMLRQKFRSALENRATAPRITHFNHALTQICDALVGQFNCKILLLPRYPTKPWMDVEYLHWVRTQTKNSARIYVFDRDIFSPEDYLSIYHHFDMLVSTALHDAIFATALDRPCVKLYYEQKGFDFFKALGSEDRMLDWEVLFTPQGVGKVVDRVAYTLDHWQALLPRIMTNKVRLQELALENINYLKLVIDKKSIPKAEPSH